MILCNKKGVDKNFLFEKNLEVYEFDALEKQSELIQNNQNWVLMYLPKGIHYLTQIDPRSILKLS